MPGTLVAMPRKTPLLTFLIEPELLTRIDDFRFANRFGTRAAAIKWLLSAALDAGLTPQTSRN